ncbi:MAG: FAD-dependent oxidoreductase, partial [Pseudomonadota bacterium]
MRVAIAGAGIAGLTAALAFARQGAEVSVFEKAPALEEVGAGLQLSPNAMHVLSALGLEDSVMAKGVEPEVATIRHWKSGRRYFNSPLRGACRDRYGAPFSQIHRADLLELLVDAATAAGAKIRTGTAVEQYDRTMGVSATLSDGAAVKADLLIGADGIHSAVRTQMLGPEEPVFTGQVAWRALVPVDALPPGLVKPEATVWAGPGHHVVTYLLRDRTLANIVAVQERPAWQEESWTIPGDAAALQTAFRDWHPDVTGLLARVEQCYLWGLFTRPPLPRWSDGPVVLIGDACHPTLPFMAQGAAMGIEDAGRLAAMVRASDDLAATLIQFKLQREPRTTRL